jgi:hypothetical protein
MSAQMIDGIDVAKEKRSAIRLITYGFYRRIIGKLIKNSMDAAERSAAHAVHVLIGFYEGGRFIVRLLFYKSVGLKITA